MEVLELLRLYDQELRAHGLKIEVLSAEPALIRQLLNGCRPSELMIRPVGLSGKPDITVCGITLVEDERKGATK